MKHVRRQTNRSAMNSMSTTNSNQYKPPYTSDSRSVSIVNPTRMGSIMAT